MKNASQFTLLCVACLAIVFLVTGCQRRVTGLFAMTDLGEIERMAVMGLDANQEQMFIANYLKIFRGQNITFVARHDDYDHIEAEQSFLFSKRKRETAEQKKQRAVLKQLEAGVLNEDTRAMLEEILGAEAVAICSFDEEFVPTTFSVRIVNVSTGAIVAGAIVEGPGHFNYLSHKAVNKIHLALDKQRRTFYSGKTKQIDSQAYASPMSSSF